jgi:hypothetical protein
VTTGQTWAIVGGGLALVFGGGVGAYLWYSKDKEAPAENQVRRMDAPSIQQSGAPQPQQTQPAPPPSRKSDPLKDFVDFAGGVLNVLQNPGVQDGLKTVGDTIGGFLGGFF